MKCSDLAMTPFIGALSIWITALEKEERKALQPRPPATRAPVSRLGAPRGRTGNSEKPGETRVGLQARGGGAEGRIVRFWR